MERIVIQKVKNFAAKDTFCWEEENNRKGKDWRLCAEDAIQKVGSHFYGQKEK